MRQSPDVMSPDRWMSHIFSARSAREGGVVRRRSRDIERFVGREAFLAEMRRRGFQVIENSGHVLIFCNRDPIRRLI